MAIEAQANMKEIGELHQNNASLTEKMDKLNMEVTVIITEKLSLKKEYNRVEGLYTTLQRDNKELRMNYNLLVDENSATNIQNSKYRGLILDNEQKFSIIDKEI